MCLAWWCYLASGQHRTSDYREDVKRTLNSDNKGMHIKPTWNSRPTWNSKKANFINVDVKGTIYVFVCYLDCAVNFVYAVPTEEHQDVTWLTGKCTVYLVVCIYLHI